MASVYKRTARNGKPAKRWTALYRCSETGKYRTKSGYSDKASTQALANRLERESARRAEGLVDMETPKSTPTPILEILDDFMLTEIERTRAPRYRQQIRSRIDRVIKETGAEHIQDLSTVQVARVLESIKIGKRPLAPASRSDYVMTIKRFTNWALLNNHIEYDPLAGLKSPGRPAAQAAHPRRALTDEEMARLLRAAAERPLMELQTIRTGKNKGKQLAKVRPEIRERAIQLGEERRLAYLAVRWSALRRSELKSLQWSDVFLEADVPHIRLRARATKSKRADSVVLHPQIVDELQKYRPDDPGPTDLIFRTIPDMKCLKADLKHAGIEYGNAEIGFADFHAIGRVTSNTNLAAAGVSQRSRQAFMRHSHPALTECTYTDERLLPIADEIRRVPAI